MRSLALRASLALIVVLGLTGCNDDVYKGDYSTDKNGTSAQPAFADPAPTSLGSNISGGGNGQNAPHSSLPKGPGVLRNDGLDKGNILVLGAEKSEH